MVGGGFRSVGAGQKKLAELKPEVYRPKKKNAAVYGELYRLYRRLHDAMGTSSYQGDLKDVMKELIAVRDKARS